MAKDAFQNIKKQLNFENEDQLEILSEDLIEFKKQYPDEESYINNIKKCICFNANLYF